MKEKSIKKTAICYWSMPDDCYVVESSLFPRTAGIGDTPEEARQHFDELLDEIFFELEQGNVAGYGKPGRPPKYGEDFHARIRKGTKKNISQYAKKLGISQGEFIDHLVFVFQVFSDPEGAKLAVKPSVEAIYRRKEEVSAVKKEMENFVVQLEGRPLLKKRKIQYCRRSTVNVQQSPEFATA